MPPKTRSQSERPERSEVPHPLPHSEESEHYESADEDSAERETPNISETASKRRDANMASESGTASAASELPRIEDGLNRLKPSNFKCELLNYDNVKTWNTG